MLTQETLQSLLHYCPETGVFTWRIASGRRVQVGSVAGSVDSNCYVVIAVNRKKYKAHRLAWFYMYGNFPPNDIDHINRVGTDNRLSNLRLATHAENLQNKSIYRNNTSGHIGVTWNKSAEKWQARIYINLKEISLGYFSNLSEAIAARQAAELQYHTFQHA